MNLSVFNNIKYSIKIIMFKIYKSVFFILSIIIIICATFLVVGRDSSLNEKFFIKNIFKNNIFNKTYHPIQNDFVLFKLDNDKMILHPYLGNKNLIKKVACVAGNYLEIRDNKVFCNNKLISTYPDFNKIKKDINIELNSKFNSEINNEKFYEIKRVDFLKNINFQYSSIIPNDFLFVVGTNPRSYDSKYFGLIHKSSIKDYLIPISHIFYYPINLIKN